MRIIAGEGLSDANMLKAFEQCDQDGTGNIDYQEFLAGQTELKKWKQKRKPKKK
jgi:Ca2+-binding EF-hand superfamily protein